MLEFNKRFGENPKNPYVSIIIIAYNTGEELIQCLRSISRQTNKNFECIIVDNSNEDLSRLAQFNINYFKLDKNYGPSYARNYGVSHAKGELLVFLDDDAVAKNDLIAITIRTFKDKSIVAVRGKVIPKTKSKIYNHLARHYDLGNKVIDFMLVPECNCAVRKSDFLDVGGFDPKLYGHEGTDLSYRLLDHGRQVYVPNAIAYHDYGDNLKHYLKKQYRHGYNKKLFSQNHPELIIYGNQFSFPTKDYSLIDLYLWQKLQLFIIRVISFGSYCLGIVMYRMKVILMKREASTHLYNHK